MPSIESSTAPNSSSRRSSNRRIVMGRPSLFSCLNATPHRRRAKLVFWGGHSTFLAADDSHLAADLMLQFPGRVVCPADSFYMGHPIPALSADDEVLPGQTYLLLPADRVRNGRPLTAASLAGLSPSPGKVAIAGAGRCPFAYVKDSDGRRRIKVLPEFVERVVMVPGGEGEEGRGLCSTPELRKHYEQLVGSRRRPWSPTLEMISERKRGRTASTAALSPVRLLGFSRRSRG